MTTQFLTADISWDEGVLGRPVLEAYPDPLSPYARALKMNLNPNGKNGQPWTIGYGTTGPDVVEGTVWTADKCCARRDARIENLIDQCKHFFWWENISDARQDVFVNMAYQMGFTGLLHFTHMLEAVGRGDWERVAEEMKESLWAKQTPTRAERLAEQARTGVRTPQSYDHQAKGMTYV